MRENIKSKQIAVRFDAASYENISTYAKKEHRGLGEFVRHATLFYIEHIEKHKKNPYGKETEWL